MVATTARKSPKRHAGDAARTLAKPPARNVVWLASYPKSGNTWLRIFLVNYLFDRTAPAPINDVAKIGIADNAAEIYRQLNGGRLDPGNNALALRLRARLLAALGKNGSDLNLVKTHSGNYTIAGAPLCPAAVSRAAVLILRDPRDVCVSYARHFGLPIARAAASMSNGDNSTAGSERYVKQYLGTWSEHALSWARATAFPVLVLRYEDMLSDPEAEFARVVAHLGLPKDAGRLTRAVRFSAFDEVSRQEDATPFTERSGKSGKFFHTGTSGQWQGALGEADIATIAEANAEAMQRYGYL